LGKLREPALALWEYSFLWHLFNHQDWPGGPEICQWSPDHTIGVHHETDAHNCQEQQFDTYFEFYGHMTVISNRESILIQGVKKELLLFPGHRSAVQTLLMLAIQTLETLQTGTAAALIDAMQSVLLTLRAIEFHRNIRFFEIPKNCHIPPQPGGA
jgi:hypothetical protein